MDFFGAQDQARKRTRRLVIAYILCIAGVVLGIYVALAMVLVASQGHSLFDPALFIAVAVIVSGIILAASASRFALWRSGGGAVARSLGAREVPADPADPLEQRLRNVVEEMAIASGLPVPEVYVLDKEDGINAFAAGHHPGDAAVAVTRGALRRLSRDELQGVIAHEFSHIRHGDMALNLRLAGFAFGLAVLALVGYLLLRTTSMMGRSRSRNGGGVVAGLLLAGALIWLFGSLGELAARLLQSAVSRQREFLADAAAVQFTRNPGGLAGALRRIASEAAGSKIESSRARETAHLFFAPALTGGLSSLFATHPPLQDRLKALDPQGLHATLSPAAALGALAPRGKDRPVARPQPGRGAVPALAGLAAATEGAAPAAAPVPAPVAGGEADPGQAALVSAARDLADLPGSIRAAGDIPLAAAAVALLLACADHSGPPPLPAANDALSGPDLDHQLDRLRPVVAGLASHLRLIALEHVAPAFRKLGPGESIALRRRLDRLAYADDQVTAYELALLLLARSRLSGPPEIRSGGFHPFAADGVRVLSALALAGGTAPDQVATVVAGALKAVDLPAAPPGPLADAGVVLEAADRLRALPWTVRPAFLNAAACVVESDGRLSAAEHDLLTALAHALDSPLPALSVPLR